MQKYTSCNTCSHNQWAQGSGLIFIFVRLACMKCAMTVAFFMSAGIRSWDVDLNSCNLNLYLQEFLSHHTVSFKVAGKLSSCWCDSLYQNSFTFYGAPSPDSNPTRLGSQKSKGESKGRKEGRKESAGGAVEWLLDMGVPCAQKTIEVCCWVVPPPYLLAQPYRIQSWGQSGENGFVGQTNRRLRQ